MPPAGNGFLHFSHSCFIKRAMAYILIIRESACIRAKSAFRVWVAAIVPAPSV